MNDPINPYRLPDSVVGEGAEIVVEELVNASKWRRLCTFLLDWGFRLALMFVMALPLGVFGSEATLARVENMTRVDEFVIGLTVLLLYYFVFETVWGRTPAKWILGTRVVDEQGRAPSRRQILGRTLTRVVPFEAFSLLLADDADARGWHDRWSHTRVVRVRKPG